MRNTRKALVEEKLYYLIQYDEIISVSHMEEIRDQCKVAYVDFLNSFWNLLDKRGGGEGDTGGVKQPAGSNPPSHLRLMI